MQVYSNHHRYAYTFARRAPHAASSPLTPSACSRQAVVAHFPPEKVILLLAPSYRRVGETGHITPETQFSLQDVRDKLQFPDCQTETCASKSVRQTMRALLQSRHVFQLGDPDPAACFLMVRRIAELVHGIEAAGAGPPEGAEKLQASEDEILLMLDQAEPEFAEAGDPEALREIGCMRSRILGDRERARADACVQQVGGKVNKAYNKALHLRERAAAHYQQLGGAHAMRLRLHEQGLPAFEAQQLRDDLERVMATRRPRHGVALQARGSLAPSYHTLTAARAAGTGGRRRGPRQGGRGFGAGQPAQGGRLREAGARVFPLGAER